MVWYSHLFQNFPQFIVNHTVKGFGIVNKAEIDVFLELSCFFDDPADVGNLISGFSAFSKTSLNIWKFLVHVLLKPGLVIAAMKLKDATPWKESYDQTWQHIEKQRDYFANKGPSSQGYGFSSGHGCESWTIKKAEHQRIDDF